MNEDEIVYYRKKNVKFQVSQPFPLWELLEMPPEYLKACLERMAKDLGYYGMSLKDSIKFDAPTVIVRFDMIQTCEAEVEHKK